VAILFYPHDCLKGLRDRRSLFLMGGQRGEGALKQVCRASKEESN
jgi:hypothetical protein